MPSRVKSAMLVPLLGILVTGASLAQQRPIEIGVDAGLSLSFNGSTVTTFGVPIQSLRFGFFASDAVSLEPSISFNYLKIEGRDAATALTFGLDALYHLQTAARARPYLTAGGQVRFVDRGFGSGDAQFALGGGLGVNVPLVPRLDLRLEGNFVHSFATDVFVSRNAIAALIGLSFMTR